MLFERIGARLMTGGMATIAGGETIGEF